MVFCFNVFDQIMHGNAERSGGRKLSQVIAMAVAIVVAVSIAKNMADGYAMLLSAIYLVAGIVPSA